MFVLVVVIDYGILNKAQPREREKIDKTLVNARLGWLDGKVFYSQSKGLKFKSC